MPSLSYYVLPVLLMPEVLPVQTCMFSEHDRSASTFVALAALHVVLCGLLGGVPTLRAKLHAAAHQGCVLFAFCFFAANGWIGWWRLHDLLTDKGAVHATHAGACVLGTSMAGFQLYDLLSTLFVRAAHSTVVRGKNFVPIGFGNDMVAHHVLTLGLALGGAHQNTFHLYFFFFSGLFETSSVPLAAVDLFRNFPALAEVAPHCLPCAALTPARTSGPPTATPLPPYPAQLSHAARLPDSGTQR